MLLYETTNTYQQFRDAFENRYWNIHVQRQVRDQIEYGRYDIVYGMVSLEYGTIYHITN